MSVTILKPLYHENHKRLKRLSGRKLQETRRRIFADHLYRCAICKHITTELELDHIVPVERGGTDQDHNLQPLCFECHAHKSSKERQLRDTGGR